VDSENGKTRLEQQRMRFLTKRAMCRLRNCTYSATVKEKHCVANKVEDTEKKKKKKAVDSPNGKDE
jgi:hypothetical protein